MEEETNNTNSNLSMNKELSDNIMPNPPLAETSPIDTTNMEIPSSLAL
ncbi:2671_t:CDS:2 [Gigaspora margarita]|uniref:2671_t:CDS:1 n=1 Tax=Gigaspora margarita TaxID=4874 RepID=A0ABM8VX07_GIGMA|nr:2671_t:CDS:2 [Gigaspora margarita]